MMTPQTKTDSQRITRVLEEFLPVYLTMELKWQKQLAGDPETGLLFVHSVGGCFSPAPSQPLTRDSKVSAKQDPGCPLLCFLITSLPFFIFQCFSFLSCQPYLWFFLFKLTVLICQVLLGYHFVFFTLSFLTKLLPTLWHSCIFDKILNFVFQTVWSWVYYILGISTGKTIQTTK